MATTLGGAEAKPRLPVVTIATIAACVLMFLWQRTNPNVTADLSLRPMVLDQQPWRLITNAYLHSPDGLMHIALNMFSLYMVGAGLEQLLGRARFAALYLVSIIGGALGFIAIEGPVIVVNGVQYASSAVGASGAIFGLFGALLVAQRKFGGPIGQLLGLLLVNAVIGFLVPNIAWQAHLGGFLVGATAMVWLLFAAARRFRPALTFGVLGAAAAVMSGLSFWLAAVL